MRVVVATIIGQKSSNLAAIISASPWISIIKIESTKGSFPNT